MEEAVNNRLSEVGMINVMENKVLGPMIQQRIDQAQKEGHDEGLEEGLEQGYRAACQKLLRDLLTQKFGPLPLSATRRLSRASVDELMKWTKRVLPAETLEDALR